MLKCGAHRDESLETDRTAGTAHSAHYLVEDEEYAAPITDVTDAGEVTLDCGHRSQCGPHYRLGNKCPLKPRPLDGRRPSVPERRALPGRRRRARGMRRQRPAKLLPAAFSLTRSIAASACG